MNVSFQKNVLTIWFKRLCVALVKLQMWQINIRTSNTVSQKLQDSLFFALKMGIICHWKEETRAKTLYAFTVWNGWHQTGIHSALSRTIRWEILRVFPNGLTKRKTLIAVTISDHRQRWDFLINDIKLKGVIKCVFYDIDIISCS